MTLTEILDLPTEDLEKLSNSQLESLLGPFIPDARRPDKDRAEDRDRQNLMDKAKRLLEGAKL